MDQVQDRLIEDEESMEEEQKRQVKILMNRISFNDDPDANQVRKL